MACCKVDDVLHQHIHRNGYPDSEQKTSLMYIESLLSVSASRLKVSVGFEKYESASKQGRNTYLPELSLPSHG
eukprot:scaffold196719_cov16-Prasinocladus_malaysianus.AAC.1